MTTRQNDGTFQKLTATDERGHGTTAVLVCGFIPADQTQLRTLLADDPGLATLPLVFVGDADADLTLHVLATRPDNHGFGAPSTLPRALIMSGLSGHELHALMRRYRTHTWAPPLWASVTPTSQHWTARTLLHELTREKDALREAMQQQRNAPSGEPT